MHRSRAASPALLGVSLHAIALALIAFYLAIFVVRNTALQWDLETYLWAAQAAQSGLDPYRLESLSTVAGRPAELPFVYPAIAIFPFLALAQLPASSAFALWIVAKMLLLMALVAAWARWFAPRAGVLPIAIAAVFGWNAAALWDLRAGNIALFETAFLWAGFGCFISGRRTAFAALIVAAACFKIVPAVFLLLLLVPTDRPPSAARFAVALALLAALIVVPLVVGPASHWASFLARVPDATTLGDANPSSLGLVTVLVHAVVTDSLAAPLALAVWIAYAGGLLALSVPFLRDTWAARDSTRWVMTAVFLELLLAPRPMAYGYLHLVPAPFYFQPAPFDGAAGRMLLALILAAQGLSRLAGSQPASLAVLYAPLLLTLALWLLIVRAPARLARTA
jgi:hypothetical protein